jgi:hypothetical protein
MNRDASIQRFEYTCEAVWKTAQLYLRNFENLELASPSLLTGSIRTPSGGAKVIRKIPINYS